MHFLEVAVRACTYPDKSVAVVTTHYTQTVWLDYCVSYVGSRVCEGRHPILMAVATLERFQGLQAQVILAFLLSHVPRIMSDGWRANTLTSRAHPQLHLFWRFAAWADHYTWCMDGCIACCPVRSWLSRCEHHP